MTTITRHKPNPITKATISITMPPTISRPWPIVLSFTEEEFAEHKKLIEGFTDGN